MIDFVNLNILEELNLLLREHDIFCFASLSEGSPRVVLEAMANGLPVVCSNIRGNSDLIDDGKGGYLVNPRNIIEFCDMILKFSKDSNLCREFGKYNRELIKLYSLENVIREMNRVYKERSQ